MSPTMICLTCEAPRWQRRVDGVNYTTNKNQYQQNFIFCEKFLQFAVSCHFHVGQLLLIQIIAVYLRIT